MDFYTVLDQVLALLRQRGRVSYRALKRQFDLDDDALADLQEELLYAHYPVVDEDGRGLVWTGAAGSTAALSPQDEPAASAPRPPEAERRQLTVLFCDLVDSTRLSRQLDPEDYREVVRAYQAAAAEVVQRFDGYIAQYLGDGLLVYFGYPQAHEDDVQRAGRAGLAMVQGIASLHTRLARDQGLRLAVRVGIHTGAAVVGAIGGGGRQEQLALGDTPNLAARLQGLAAPNTVVVSATTHGLIEGFFTCQALGEHTLKGVEEPMLVYQLLAESGAQTRLDAVAPHGLTPLVGREQELGLLLARWAQSAEGRGQVVLVSGEAGIGKSRLVEVLREHLGREPAMWLTFRCSPYHTNSALYPVITHLQRALQFQRDEPAAARLDRLESALQATRLPLEEAVPLMAALLSVPLAARYPPLDWSPQKHKQKPQEALVAWLVAEAECLPVLAVWEDLHWADPSTLELLDLVLDQTPTASLCILLTCRPEFSPPWTLRSYLTQLTLTRLTRPQVEEMVQRITGGKALPAEVVQQIVAKTDGVPLFVEELTKMVLESGLLREHEERYELTGPLPPLAIPATLQDALMARLDRLTEGKAVAQLGAVLGRTFAYELLQAVASLDELALWHGLVQLVQAEVLYQRGVPPHATYMFKHALLQEAAYQSLLRSTRQQYHQRTAQVVAERFPDLAETQPELLAQHYTEAGLSALAIPYWQRAGERTLQRSAHVEAIAHLSRGLGLLETLPPTPECTQQEIMLYSALGGALMATRGYAAPEVEQAYRQAYQLCQQAGDPGPLFPVLAGLAIFYTVRAEHQTAREVAEQFLTIAQDQPDPVFRLQAHTILEAILFYLGELAAAQAQAEQGIALYDRQQHRSLVSLYGGNDPGVTCLAEAATIQWLLGYPDQALQRGREALALAQELAHPLSRAFALIWVARFHLQRRDWQAAAALLEALIALCTEQGFAFYLAGGMALRGCALAGHGRVEEGIAEIRQGLAAMRATGAEVGRRWFLAQLAAAYGQSGQAAEGLTLLAEALASVPATGEHYWEPELYRLQGELLLVLSAERHTEAAACFQQALKVARQQQAKSLELRAAMSLSRLWQYQGQQGAARELLAPIYGWFTEGFDTADLQEAKALLDALA